MAQTTLALYFRSIKDTVRGSRNSKKPVSLFIAVCSKANRWFRRNPNVRFMIFTSAMTKKQLQGQIGIFSAGNSFMNAATTNTKSATESNPEPKADICKIFLQVFTSKLRLNDKKSCSAKV